MSFSHQALRSTIGVFLLASCSSQSETPEAIPRVEDQLEQLEGEVREAQEAIQLCMKQQGFTYTVTSEAGRAYEVAASAERLTSDEFIDQFGFGTTTFFDPEIYSASQTALQSDLDALDDAGKSAFNDALYSNGLNDDNGCIAAGDAALRTSEVERDARFDERVAEELLADPRVFDLNVDWSECMAGQGYEYGDPAQIFTSLSAELGEIIGAGRSGPEIDGDRVRELQATERRVAMASRECGYTPAKESAEMQAIRAEVEQRIRAELEGE